MEQRPLRLGDILDDYCPRERRLTNHAIVAMIEEDVKQTRCTTCDAEHAYKGRQGSSTSQEGNDRRRSTRKCLLAISRPTERPVRRPNPPTPNHPRRRRTFPFLSAPRRRHHTPSRVMPTARSKCSLRPERQRSRRNRSVQVNAEPAEAIASEAPAGTGRGAGASSADSRAAPENRRAERGTPAA